MDVENIGSLPGQMSPDSRGKVSSITITLNEEDNIGECLDSISWCDEHVVVDEFSDDDTVSIAEDHGARVFQARKPEEAITFDVLRREALQHASHDWILLIDADERSHSCLNERLQELVGAPGIDIVQLPRMTYIGDEWVKTGRRWWPDYRTVLFRRDFVQIQDRIHSYLHIADGADVVRLPPEPETALYHYSYQSIMDLLYRRWRYSAIQAKTSRQPFYVLLYFALSDIVQGIIVDRGIAKGSTGILVPIIDALYHIFTLVRRSV